MDLGYLSLLDAKSFEAERNRLIADEILKAAPERRLKLVQLQAELDRVRDTSTSEQFMAYLATRLTENLQNLNDQLGVLKHLLGHAPDVLPAHQR